PRSIPMASAPLLLLFTLSFVSAAADSKPDGGQSKAKASLTIEGEDPADSMPPYPEGAEKIAIRDYILDHSAPIRECYEKRLVERPTLQGKLVARFDIGPSGAVIGATADGISDRE